MAAALALGALAGCGGSDGTSGVPTVTFAGGSSTTAASDGGASSTAAASGGNTSTSVAGTTTTAPATTAPTAATPTTAAGGSTTLTTGTLASLPPGATEASVPGADAATVDAILQGYLAWQAALRAVATNPSAPPWDQLKATTTAGAYTELRASFEDVFAQGQSFVLNGQSVNRPKIDSVLGPTVASVDDCQTEWSYRVDTASGTPVPGEEEAAAGPTNTGYHVNMVREGGVWRVDGYDSERPQLCAGIS